MINYTTQTKLIDGLNPQSQPDSIHAVLKDIAITSPDPIILEKLLRRIAQRVQTSFKAVQQSYEILLKRLSIKPVDIGLSIAQELLKEKYSDGICLRLTSDGVFLAYTGTHWMRIEESKIRSQLQKIAVNFKGTTNKTLHAIVLDALGSLKDYLGHNQEAISLNENAPPVINCKNGELWINASGIVDLRPHKPESQLLYCLPYDYDPKATCKKFDLALLEIFANSKEPEEMRRYIYELMGYAIQSRRPIPCFWLLIGHGANGKTTFLQTLCRLISPVNLYNIDMSTFGKDKFNLSQLQGKLVMIDDDIKMDTLIPDGLLKKISESKLFSARCPYGRSAFSFLNTALPIMAGNHYPLCNDLSDGLFRRAMVIPFNRKFKPEEQDKAKFEDIWLNEMSGILNRAIEGYQRVAKLGRFNPPQECLDARKEFLAHGNPLYCFLSECLEKSPEERIPFPDLRTAYEAWAKQQNISRLSVLNKTLKRRLQSLGYEIGTNNGYSCLIGYEIKAEE